MGTHHLTIALVLLCACDQTGIAYPQRLPEIEVTCLEGLPTSDTVSLAACTGLTLADVPYGRSGSIGFSIANPGLAVLQVELAVPDGRFQVTPASESLDIDERQDFLLSYTPDGFEPVNTVLGITHNTNAATVELLVEATTDADADDDGYAHRDSPGGDDCNDQNAGVNPGADDGCYDGLDQDCDGHSDYDCDFDGFDSRLFGGDDCDDTDASVNPSATEVWYDDLDQDCNDGSDWDADGDGYDTDEHFGTDCDDTDATVHPDASDPLGDGVDQDCNGSDG